MPHSLPILEALYAKLFLGGNNGLDSSLLGKANSLRPEAVVWQLVKFFAGQEAEGARRGQERAGVLRLQPKEPDQRQGEARC